MSSQFTFTVRFPTGHCVSVRVSPNDPVSRIVEEACAKRKGDYDPMGFTVGKQGPAGRLLPVDKSLTIRHANLANRSTLDLEEVDDATRSSAVVILCLQSESGKRWQEELSDGSTLWEAIERSGFMKEIPERAEINVVPVIVYMAKEVIGEESLKKTTLRRLGLSSGRALARLLFRNPDVLKDQAMSGQINARTDTKNNKGQNSPPRRAMRVDDGRSFLQKMEDEMKSDDIQTAVQQEPREEVQTITSKEEPEPGENIDLLPTSSHLPLSDTQQEQMETDHTRREEVEEEPILHYIGENNAVVFVSGDIPRVGRVSAADVSDAFYELTESDVRKLYQESVRAVKEAEEGSELTTSAMREARREAKKLNTLQTYRKTVVRVQLPDQVALQATFLSGQTVGDVMNFLRQFLASPRMDFELFVAPPRTVLVPENSLLDAGCVPSANLYFSLKDKEEKWEGAFLKDDIMAKKSNFKGAMKAAQESGVLRKTESSAALSSLEATGGEPGPSRPSHSSSMTMPEQSGNSNRQVTTTDKKDVPKWFKLGQQ